METTQPQLLEVRSYADLAGARTGDVVLAQITEAMRIGDDKDCYLVIRNNNGKLGLLEYWSDYIAEHHPTSVIFLHDGRISFVNNNGRSSDFFQKRTAEYAERKKLFAEAGLN